MRMAASTLSMISVHSSFGAFLFETQKSFPLPRSQKFIVPLFHNVDMEIQVQLPRRYSTACGRGGEKSLPPDYGGRASTELQGACLQGLDDKSSLPRHE